jgi:hypothetical protein
MPWPSKILTVLEALLAMARSGTEPTSFADNKVVGPGRTPPFGETGFLSTILGSALPHYLGHASQVRGKVPLRPERILSHAHTALKA